MEGSQSSSALQSVVSTYRKAPIAISLFASYFVSQIVSRLWLDYRLFVALPGGPLPKNVFGWAVHYFALSPLSLHSSWTNSRLVRAFLPRTPAEGQGKGRLSTGARLPRRQGLSPLTAGTIPHRQLDQFHHDDPNDAAAATETAIQQAREAVEHIQSELSREAEAQPSHLRIGSSLVEKDSIALFAVSHTLVTGSDGVSRSTRSAQFPSPLSRRFLSSMKAEFVHIHRIPPSTQAEQTPEAGEDFGMDGSLHVTLHPDDAALVVEKGWGELHPLAGFPSYTGFWVGWPAWLTRLTGGSKTRSARWWSASSVPTAGDAKVTKALGLPPTYCLIYSPRDMEEAKVVKDIVDAATGFAIGARPSSR